MDLFTPILTLFFGLIVFVYWLINRKLTYWEVRNVPHIKPEFFYGNARGIGKIKSSSDIFQEVYFKLKNQGPLVGVYIFFMPMAIITDLELIKTILVKEFDIFTNRGIYFNKVHDPISANLAAIEDGEWKSLRNKLTPVFTSGKIKMMFPIIDEVADVMIQYIEKASSSVEMKEMFSRFTTDVIGKAAFGIECNTLNNKDSEFYDMGQKSFGPISTIKRQFINGFPDLARKFRIKQTRKDVVDFFTNVIEQTIKYRRANNIERNDFLSIVIKMMNESKLDFNELLTQSLTFFNGGFETSATTLTFCMYELAQRKDIQEKARESVQEVLQRHDGKYTYEAVSDMKYIEQCVKESLRMHSPAGGTRRIAKKDYKVPNTNIIIEKGMGVIIPFNGIHFDPEYYPDPHTYNPDNFAPETMAKRHNFTFLPFGEGPRVCIGERFAMLEIKAALAKVIMNFEMDLDRSKTSTPLEFLYNRILLTPKSGVYINFKKL